MYQYTTPKHTFLLSMPLEELEACNITYAQHDRVLFTKTLADAEESTGNKLILHLTQKETGKFDSRFPAQIQLHAKTITGMVIASDVYEIEVEKLLDQEI